MQDDNQENPFAKYVTSNKETIIVQKKNQILLSITHQQLLNQRMFVTYLYYKIMLLGSI